MKKITLHFYNDLGHGWCKIKRSHPVFKDVAHRISPYSYQRGEYVYLEEDCDFAIFFDHLQAVGGWKYTFREHYANKRSRIRSYDNYYYINER